MALAQLYDVDVYRTLYAMLTAYFSIVIEFTGLECKVSTSILCVVGVGKSICKLAVTVLT